MKVLFDYNEATGTITDINGLTACMPGMAGLEQEPQKNDVLEMMKQGMTADDLIKLKNADVI